MKSTAFDKLVGEALLDEDLNPLQAAVLSAALLFGTPSTSAEAPVPAPITQQNQSFTNIAKKLIIKHEGTKPKVYKDDRGIPTIGVGFNLARGDAKQQLSKIGANYEKVIAGEPLSTKQIAELLNITYEEAYNIAKRVVPSFEQQPDFMKAVLVNMAFALGERGLKGFKDFVAAVGNRNYEKAADELTDSQWFRKYQHNPNSRPQQLAGMVRTQKILEGFRALQKAKVRARKERGHTLRKPGQPGRSVARFVTKGYSPKFPLEQGNLHF